VRSGAICDGIEAARMAASRYVAGRFGGVELRPAGERCPNLDDGFTARVAAKFDQLPNRPADGPVREAYLRLREESRAQYDAIRAAGVAVLPWERPGQPYTTARQMWTEVDRTGVLYVFLTSSGHGPDEERDPANPMLAPSGLTAGGVPLSYNDLFRAVHDFFGHGLHGDHFTLRGELRAAYSHLQMFSAGAHPAVFTETVAQICWFYAGSHLVSQDGVIPQPRQPGWLAPPHRPYPPQKIAIFPDSFLLDFQLRFAGPGRLGVSA
jgi:hypothetical protein